MIRIGVVGYGYWGPRIVRNFDATADCEVAMVCDKSPESLQRVKQAHPHVKVTSNLAEFLTSPDLDAIAVVTPVWTHFELAKAALNNGKHVFVEKPFTSTAVQAMELIDLAEKKRLQIMVDHWYGTIWTRTRKSKSTTRALRYQAHITFTSCWSVTVPEICGRQGSISPKR